MPTSSHSPALVVPVAPELSVRLRSLDTETLRGGEYMAADADAREDDGAGLGGADGGLGKRYMDCSNAAAKASSSSSTEASSEADREELDVIDEKFAFGRLV